MSKLVPALPGMAADLRERREALGRTQFEVAEGISRSQSHVSAFERGWGRSDARALDAWALDLGCRWALIPLGGGDGQG